MSASRPPSGRQSPASASGRRSPATSRSPRLLTEDGLLRLFDLDNRADSDSDGNFSLLNAPLWSGSIVEDSSAKIYTPKNADKPQECIVIAKAERNALCLGKVGSSKRFCLATKELGYSHCGVAVHCRTS